MFGNSDKKVLIPPTTNQLPQTHHIDDDDKVSIGSSSSGRVMEKQKRGEEQLVQQQEALKCPRCDSCNTKFCYYNNYSLSQPRHFCKACKRYWTRGGTLRNVPVGGGCRKNKRLKRPSTTSSSPIHILSAPSATSKLPIDIASSTSNHINPLFYALPSNSTCDVNLQFSRFSSSSGYDLQSQMNALGLGFSSAIVMAGEAGADNGYTNGFTFLSNYSSTFTSCSTSTTSAIPVMSSSTLLQQKFINGGGGVDDGPDSNTTFQGLAPLMASNGSEAGMFALKDVKVEGGQKRLEWNGACQNQMEHVPLSYPWNTATPMAAWNDQVNNIGPSLTSLI